MEKENRESGIDVIGNVPWGAHFCLFYETKEDLIGLLVPYFKAGLENNEFCIWVTSEPLEVEDAKVAIRQAVDVDRYIEKGQIEILDYKEWYTRSGEFNAEEVLKIWVEKENQAVKRGFDGLRLTGNTFWLEDKDWGTFLDYEATVNGIIGEHRVLALCTYSLGKCGSSEIIEVISAHQSALIRREGKWEHIESTEKRIAQEEILKVRDFYKSILDGIIGGVWVTDKDDIIRYTNKGMTGIAGIVQEQIVGARLEDFPESGFKSLKPFYLKAKERSRPVFYEAVPVTTPPGRLTYQSGWLLPRIKDGKYDGMICTVEDVTEKKEIERALKRSYAKLEHQTHKLEESNTALKVLLRQRDEDRIELEEKVSSNVKELVLPYLEKLEKSGFNNSQETLIEIIKSNLEEIISPWVRKLSSKYLNLTPTEIQVANLVKQGLSTKEIAVFSSSSPETISRHRKSIRKKLKLTDKKANLRTHLLSLH